MGTKLASNLPSLTDTSIIYKMRGSSDMDIEAFVEKMQRRVSAEARP